MGCGAGSPIVISLDREKALYYAGEVVSGTIQLNVKGAQLKADEVDLKLYAVMGYSTGGKCTDTGFNRNTDTGYRHISFLSTKYVFAQPQGGERELTYGQGQYAWPFQIQLPTNIPPTLSLPKAYPHVQYQLEVVVNRARNKRNLREKRYIGVFPYINLLQQPNLLVPTTFGNHNRKDIVVKGVFSKVGCVPGDSVDVKIEIENPRQILIKQIHISFIQSCHVESDSYTRKLATCTVPDLIQRRDERMEKTVEITIPDSVLPPSFQYKGGLKKTGEVSITYSCKIEVDVKGMFTDFNIDIPIIIGTHPKLQPSSE